MEGFEPPTCGFGSRRSHSELHPCGRDYRAGCAESSPDRFCISYTKVRPMTALTESEGEAWDEGFAAGADGVLADSNPYERSDPRCTAWDDGRREGSKSDREDELAPT